MTFWMDAVCINQANLEERGDQVSKTNLIFGQASKAIIWPGEPPHESGHALQILHFIGEQAEWTSTVICLPA